MSRLLVSLVLIAIGGAARADTLVLKNGNEMEGAIVSENAQSIELDIGYGTVTVQRSDIAKIRRSKKREGANKEMERRKFASGRGVPKSAASIDGAYREVLRLREKALDARREASDIQEDAQEAKEGISELKRHYQEASERAAGLDPNANPVEYRRAVADMNRASSQINGNTMRIEDSVAKTKETNAALSAYMSAFSDLKTRLGAVRGKAGPEGEYYAWLRREAASMAKDFTTDAVASESGGNGNVYVSVVVNGKATFHLEVDTGASMTVLYDGAVQAIGLKPEDAIDEFDTQVADGRSVRARVFRVDSIRVGKSVVRNTRIAVLPGSLSHSDGLLGMSFLSHFSVHLDGARGRLVLEGLKQH